LRKISQAVADRPWLDGLLVVGSLADDAADALSDIDLLVIIREKHFDQAWNERADLHGGESPLFAWDHRPDDASEIAAHRWLTSDLVLVEALIATPSSGLRLAPPWVLVAGDAHCHALLAPRPPIERSEMDGAPEAHPVETAYDEFKVCHPTGVLMT
jgi:hypothetical protein